MVTLKSELGNIASGISDEVKDVLKDQAEEIATSARSKAPVLTGNLRDSIEVIDANEPGFVGYRIMADARARPVRGRSDGAPYAFMVEYGSVHNEPPRPFMVPALEEGREPTLKAVENALGDM